MRVLEVCVKTNDEAIKQQVEEHDKMQNWVDQLEAFGTDKLALRLLDDEMGK